MTRSGGSRGLHLRPRRRRRWFRWLVVALVVVVLLAIAAVARAATLRVPGLTAKRVLPASASVPGRPPAIAWPGQGQSALEVLGLGGLGSSGAQTPQPIASLAKVMTAYVVLHDHPLRAGQSGFEVTVGAADVADYQSRLAQAQSVMAVADGEQLSELQLLEGLLVASANNVSPILARYDAGSQSSFVAKMNSTARGLGMTSTTYTDPSGFNPSTVSTAVDQLRLADQSMADPVFARIVDMPSADLPVAGTVANFDTAIGSGGFIGIKTGSDSSSGGCFVFANRQGAGHAGITILGVVLGLDRGDQSTSALIAASVQAATSMVHSVAAGVGVHTVLPAGTVVEGYSNGQGGRVVATTSAPLEAVGWGGQVFPLAFSGSPVGGHLSSGQPVGAVSTGGQTVPVVVSSSLSQAGWSWRFEHLL